MSMQYFKNFRCNILKIQKIFKDSADDEEHEDSDDEEHQDSANEEHRDSADEEHRDTADQHQGVYEVGY